MVAVDQLAAALTAALVGSRGVASAYLFGSMATGRAHRESDVDVGVLLDRLVHPRPADRFEARLRLAALLQSATGRDIDLVVLNDAPPQLGRHILTRGARLLVSNATLDHAHLRTTLSRAADIDPIDHFLAIVRDIERSA